MPQPPVENIPDCAGQQFKGLPIMCFKELSNVSCSCFMITAQLRAAYAALCSLIHCLCVGCKVNTYVTNMAAIF